MVLSGCSGQIVYHLPDCHKAVAALLKRANYFGERGEGLRAVAPAIVQQDNRAVRCCLQNARDQRINSGSRPVKRIDVPQDR